MMGQKNDTGINDSMIYQFMRTVDIDQYGKTPNEILSNKLSNINNYLKEPGVLKYITVADTSYMRDQFDKRYTFKWDSVKLKNHFRVVEDIAIDHCFNQKIDGWTLFKKKYGSGYSDYSLPLFSKDLKKVFIYKGYHCGWLCGDGYIYIFEKKDGAWKMVYQRMIWIS
jgi:hypothetical protein